MFKRDDPSACYWTSKLKELLLSFSIETEDLLKKLQPAPLFVTYGKTPSQTFGMKLSTLIIYLRTF